jgi:hypothetical protein
MLTRSLRARRSYAQLLVPRPAGAWPSLIKVMLCKALMQREQLTASERVIFAWAWMDHLIPLITPRSQTAAAK